MNLLVDPVLHGYPSAWFAPSYKVLLEAWDWTVNIIAPIIARKNSNDRRIETITGGIIEFWTLEDKDAGRSRKYKRVIVDEAGLPKHLGSAWREAIRPTLSDLRGDAWFLGTPKGRNFFFECFQRGIDPQQPDWACWQMPTSTNPFIHPDEIEDARRELPERIFQQEYEAAFLDDAGGVFRNVLACSTGTPQAAVSGAQYVAGVDWGKSNDYSVFSVWDVRSRREVWLDRSNKVDYEIQYNRLMALCERYKMAAIIAESNSIGTPAIEQLQRRGLPVQAFTTTNATKAAIIDGMALALEQGTVTLLNDPVATEEMQAYEMDRLPSGLFRYGAPEGLHDDTVMARCMALWGISNKRTGFSASYDKRRT